jgi:hypothetical protein
VLANSERKVAPMATDIVVKSQCGYAVSNSRCLIWASVGEEIQNGLCAL